MDSSFSWSSSCYFYCFFPLFFVNNSFDFSFGRINKGTQFELFIGHPLCNWVNSDP